MAQNYLYVIGPQDGPVKIGYTSDPHARLMNLQTGHDQTLKIHYLREVDADKVAVMEKIVHRQLSYRKIRGEWFNVSAEDAQLQIDHAMIRWGDEPNLVLRFRGKTLF